MRITQDYLQLEIEEKEKKQIKISQNEVAWGRFELPTSGL